MVDWTLQVGSEVTRADVKDAYGGAPYGGIVPIKTRSRNVLIYSDREEGSKYGYNFDGWATTADVFFYTGHGPLGDQTMKAGNAAILSHKKDQRPLRVFEYTGKVVQGTSTKIHRHVGEFEIDESDPYRRTDSPDENGDLRTVIVFRLLPIGDHERSQSDESEAQFSDQPSATLVDLESADVDSFEQTRSAESTEAVRRESQLVSEFETHLHALGHDTARLRLTSRSTSHPMFTDIDLLEDIMQPIHALVDSRVS